MFGFVLLFFLKLSIIKVYFKIILGFFRLIWFYILAAILNSQVCKKNGVLLYWGYSLFFFWRGRRYKCTFQPFLEIFLAICSWIDHTVVVGTTETCKLFIMKEIIEIVDIRWQCISNHLHVKSQEIQIKEVLS